MRKTFLLLNLADEYKTFNYSISSLPAEVLVEIFGNLRFCELYALGELFDSSQKFRSINNE